MEALWRQSQLRDCKVTSQHQVDYVTISCCAITSILSPACSFTMPIYSVFIAIFTFISYCILLCTVRFDTWLLINEYVYEDWRRKARRSLCASFRSTWRRRLVSRAVSCFLCGQRPSFIESTDPVRCGTSPPNRCSLSSSKLSSSSKVSRNARISPVILIRPLVSTPSPSRQSSCWPNGLSV